MSKDDAIRVTSHVSRDFLQNAAYFNSLSKVIWEYVSNSLDNAREETPVVIVVDFSGLNVLRISDNGLGMSRDDLRRFFQMHGVNIRRQSGKRVRGRFGTGKCAGFGIAKKLKIDTCQNGLRNVVELNLDAIKKAKDGQPFPVQELIVDEFTDEEDGTIVDVCDFSIKKLNLEKAINYVEKHLARYRTRAKVIINDHVCQYKEPPSIRAINLFPPADVQEHIGSVELIIKVSPIPLDKEEYGIDVLSNGIWHETTLAEVKGELTNRIFGEIDVPVLDEEAEADVPSYDNTRNNTLNRANPKVVVLLGWLAEEIEKVREEIAREEQEKRASEATKRLAKEAKRLAKILNDDFNTLMDELDLASKLVGKRKKPVGDPQDPTGDLMPGNGDQETEWQQAGQPFGNGERGKEPPGEGDVPREGPSIIPGDEPGKPRRMTDTGRRRRRGIFSIEFTHLTEEYPRSKYDRDTRTIYINLDHPQVAVALANAGLSLESRNFRVIAYEIAGVEYAQAIPFERLQIGEELDAAEALFSVRDTIDRITRRFAEVLGES
jgi:hypothetical protein